jgi:hypothetical protein
MGYPSPNLYWKRVFDRGIGRNCWIFWTDMELTSLYIPQLQITISKLHLGEESQEVQMQLHLRERREFKTWYFGRGRGFGRFGSSLSLPNSDSYHNKTQNKYAPVSIRYLRPANGDGACYSLRQAKKTSLDMSNSRVQLVRAIPLDKPRRLV